MYFHNQCRCSDTIVIPKCTSTSGSIVLPSQRTLALYIYSHLPLFHALPSAIPIYVATAASPQLKARVGSSLVVRLGRRATRAVWITRSPVMRQE